jgi:uncharacterized damage-inducible protein DinB
MLALNDRPVVTEERTCASSLAALDRALEDIAAVVSALSPEAYRARLLPDVSGSIGEHVRHCLDHVLALVSADPSSDLSYDRRHRGTMVETDPAQALRCIQILRIKAAVGRWSTWAHEPIFVSSTVSRSGRGMTGMSTLARELAFVVNHTIHHQATIGLLASLQGFDVPDGFGYAPSTPRPDAAASAA